MAIRGAEETNSPLVSIASVQIVGQQLCALYFATGVDSLEEDAHAGTLRPAALEEMQNPRLAL